MQRRLGSGSTGSRRRAAQHAAQQAQRGSRRRAARRGEWVRSARPRSGSCTGTRGQRRVLGSARFEVVALLLQSAGTRTNGRRRVPAVWLEVEPPWLGESPPQAEHLTTTLLHCNAAAPALSPAQPSSGRLACPNRCLLPLCASCDGGWRTGRGHSRPLRRQRQHCACCRHWPTSSQQVGGKQLNRASSTGVCCSVQATAFGHVLLWASHGPQHTNRQCCCA